MAVRKLGGLYRGHLTISLDGHLTDMHAGIRYQSDMPTTMLGVL